MLGTWLSWLCDWFRFTSELFFYEDIYIFRHLNELPPQLNLFVVLLTDKPILINLEEVVTDESIDEANDDFYNKIDDKYDMCTNDVAQMRFNYRCQMP